MCGKPQETFNNYTEKLPGLRHSLGGLLALWIVRPLFGNRGRRRHDPQWVSHSQGNDNRRAQGVPGRNIKNTPHRLDKSLEET
jgi:hypothetical protein